ncbi:uncharacterized protein MYCFIDRAFT_160667 [Pseudocercospora fijiensis CIRAD86]
MRLSGSFLRRGKDVDSLAGWRTNMDDIAQFCILAGTLKAFLTATTMTRSRSNSSSSEEWANPFES